MGFWFGGAPSCTYGVSVACWGESVDVPNTVGGGTIYLFSTLTGLADPTSGRSPTTPRALCRGWSGADPCCSRPAHAQSRPALLCVVYMHERPSVVLFHLLPSSMTRRPAPPKILESFGLIDPLTDSFTWCVGHRHRHLRPVPRQCGRQRQRPLLVLLGVLEGEPRLVECIGGVEDAQACCGVWVCDVGIWTSGRRDRGAHRTTSWIDQSINHHT